MTGLPGYSTIQKLRFFLAGVFPALANSGGAIVARLRERYPGGAALSDRVRSSALGQSVQRVTSTFVLGQYAAQEVDWTRLPNEAARILRVSTVAAALLCVTVPLTVVWEWPPLSAQAITGAPGDAVAGWSVVVWLGALSLAWGCLLAGTAAANRLVFLPSVAMFLYFSAAMVAALPKSWVSILVPAEASLAFVFGATRMRLDSRFAILRESVTALVAGALIAAFTIVVTPTAPWYRGRLFGSALAIGVPLGFGLMWLARGMRRRTSDPPLRADVVVAVLVAAHLLLLLSLALRGGLTIPGGGVQTLSVQMTGYLWPLYFFLGTGVVFKVLRRTQTVQSVAQNLLPPFVFVLLTLAALVVATLVPWIETVLLTPAGPWPGWMSAAASWIYRTTSWLWASQLMRYTMDTMKWVLLGALLVAVWALVRRRLTSDTMAGLFFVVGVVGFGVFEYHFQLSGFGRTPRNTALSLFIFSALVLWLVHKTVLKHVLSSSRWWPQTSRVALYGALLIFVLLPIHARAAMHDAGLSNEIFLYLFLGVINFGVPYYLYLYANHRFTEPPLSPVTALGAFAFGAVLAVPLIIADKSVVSGSLLAAWAAAGSQAHGVLQGERVMTDAVFFSPMWIVVRGLLAMSAVLVTAWAIRRRQRYAAHGRAVVACAVIAVAAGLACFSNRGLDLPLVPQHFIYFVAPLSASSIVDASLVARQVSFLLPAMLLALVLMRARGRASQFVGATAAITLHIAINLVWPSREAWLRSTGALFPVIGGGLVMLFLLAGALCHRLDRGFVRRTGGGGPVIEPGSLMTWHELRVAGAAFLVVFGAVVAHRAYTQRLAVHRIPLSTFDVEVPVAWVSQSDGQGGVEFSRQSWSDTRPRLRAELRPLSADSTRAALRLAAQDAADRLANFQPIRLETLDQYYPGALALDFRFLQTPGDENTSALGTIALAPMPNGRALRLIVTYAPSEPQRRWDVLRAVQALPR